MSAMVDVVPDQMPPLEIQQGLGLLTGPLVQAAERRPRGAGTDGESDGGRTGRRPCGRQPWSEALVHEP
jgi:hypothetical protein